MPITIKALDELETHLKNQIKYYKHKREYCTTSEYNEFDIRFCNIKITTFEEVLLRIAKIRTKYERRASPENNVVNNIFNNLRILGHVDFDGNIVIRKDSFEGLEKAYKKQYESEEPTNEQAD